MGNLIQPEAKPLRYRCHRHAGSGPFQVPSSLIQDGNPASGNVRDRRYGFSPDAGM
ncbi:MAG: hypothetical protein LUQ35_04980 [Methanoregula sp.]|nr:hypothetical protein [Methanoregula sp.]